MMRYLGFFLLRVASAAASATRRTDVDNGLTQLWDVTPSLDEDDPLYAGWDPVADVHNIEIYNGAHQKRTYSHHPILYSRGRDVYLIHTSSVVDEDTMGQNIWMAHSHDSGYTWSASRPILPPAILPNQTASQTFKYYCEHNVQQRAFQSNAIVEHNGKLFAVAQTLDFWCEGEDVSMQEGSGKYASGSVARPLYFDGSAAGDPCWIEKNSLTDYVRYNETAYGTKYGMRYCKEAAAIRKILARPEAVPAWSDFQINSGIYAADNNHSMEELTHAAWLEDVGLWQRFWRDISPSNISYSVWVEYSRTGRDWFPVVSQSYGNRIFETNMPDSISKQSLLRIPDQQLSAFLSNPRYDAETVREPLTLATARGPGVQPFRGIGVLRTNASTEVATDTRGFKAKGFQYPSAVQVGENIAVAYSENKQNIWVSIVPVRCLP